MTLTPTGPATGSVVRRPDLRRLGFGPDAVAYETAWDEQRRVLDGVVAGSLPDTVLLLEHPPTYTAGKRTRPEDRPQDGTPVVDVDRGGQITWHGPGQLVGYPIVRLAEPIDVVEHVRRLEAMLMDVCAELGVGTMRVEGRSGVWVPADAPLVGTRPERKVAAIGVRVSHGVTMHGFAINCDCDLSWFDRIVPCGITDAGVTSLTAELGRTVTVLDVLPMVEARLADGLDQWGSR
ncbi:MAG: lipoyl(octanoyl) transferase LipB [Actinomycetales bacterium]|nr:lipoyl(octanoyl) transferase LipB [Actinomycetales bacterium]